MSELGKGTYYLNLAGSSKERAGAAKDDLYEGGAYYPPTDIVESKEGIIINMELPGVALADLEVSVTGSRLVVEGKKGKRSVEEGALFSCMERVYGRFRKDFEILGALNSADSRASLKEGVLSIFIPRCEERRGKKRVIEVIYEGLEEKEEMLGKE